MSVRHFVTGLHGIWLAALLLGLAGVSGCASQPSAVDAAAQRDDLVTQSDESSERKRARIRVELALGYFEQGKTSIALDEIKQALAADATFFDAYNLRGLVYLRLNDFALAEDSFNKALMIRPQNPNVLHNLGWLKCQQAQYAQSLAFFGRALADPNYGERAKSYLTQGLCQVRAGMRQEALQSLTKSYEFDAGNPVTGYNLASVLYQQAEYLRARFYIRRLNNSELANAESLWLGIKVEKQLANTQAMAQLGTQLEKRFSQAPETAAYHRGAFNE